MKKLLHSGYLKRYPITKDHSHYYIVYRYSGTSSLDDLEVIVGVGMMVKFGWRCDYILTTRLTTK